MGLFGGIAKIAKGLISKVGGKVAGAFPGGGLIKTAVQVGGKLAKRIGRKNLKRIATGAVGAIGAGGVIAGARRRGGGGGVMGGGMPVMDAAGNVVGFEGARRRRINPGNPRAMRRAIRRIEAGARMYSKMFRIRTGHIKGAPGVRVVKFKKRAA